MTQPKNAPPHSDSRQTFGQKFVWRAAGILCVGLAILGIPLPFLPTTPFLLLAAFCFSRSSDKLHAWLMSHPRFGPAITSWHTHGVISRRSKGMAIGGMGAALGLSVWAGLPPLILMLQALVLICVAVFILTRPSYPKIKSDPQIKSHVQPKAALNPDEFSKPPPQPMDHVRSTP